MIGLLALHAAVVLALLAAALWASVRLWHSDRQQARRWGVAIGAAATLWVALGFTVLGGLVAHAPWLGPLHLPVLWATGIAGVTALARLSPESWLARPLLALPVLLGVHTVVMALGPAAMGRHLGAHEVWELDRSTVGEPAVQTAWWSCGAAAAAAILRDRGQACSEEHAARLCLTTPWLGTTPLAAASGLTRSGVPSHPLYFGDYNAVLGAPKPCLAYTRLFGRVLHVVALRGADEESVTLFDPMLGETTMTRQEFLDTWVWCLVIPTDD